MRTETAKIETTKKNPEAGVVYRTVCQNPGCGHPFDLRITPLNAGLLGTTMPCPHCHRHGGMLKSQGRLGDKLFAAKLIFPLTGVGPRADEDDILAARDGLRY